MAQLGQGAVAVDPYPEVHLGHGVDPEAVGHVDEQPQLDPVVGVEACLLEYLPRRGGFPGQGLADSDQPGEQQVDGGAGHQLGHPTPTRRGPVDGPLVEALHQGHVVVGQDRSEQTRDEVGTEVLHVGVEEDEHVAAGLGHRHQEGLALPPARLAGRHHPGPGGLGRRGGAIHRPVVDDQHLVDEIDTPGVGHQAPADGGHDRPDGPFLVAGGEADRDRPPGARRDEEGRGEVRMVEGPAAGRAHRPIIADPGRPRDLGIPGGSLTAGVPIVHHGGTIKSG